MSKMPEEIGVQILSVYQQAFLAGKNHPVTLGLQGLLMANFPQLRGQYQEFRKSVQLENAAAMQPDAHFRGANYREPQAVDMGFGASTAPFTQGGAAGQPPSNATPVQLPQLPQTLQTPEAVDMGFGQAPQTTTPEQEAANVAESDLVNEAENETAETDKTGEAVTPLSADELADLKSIGVGEGVKKYAIERLRASCQAFDIDASELKPKQVVAAILTKL